MTETQMTKLKIWILAARPKTLPAGISSVIVGGAVAVAEGGFAWLPTLAAFMGAVLLQIGANLANDYFDYLSGADDGERLGPVRVTQAGLASPREMRIAMLIVFGLAGLVGLYMASISGWWLIVVVGISSILAALAYTGGPFPFGYHGLGDVFAFIFFGPVAVFGTVFVQMKTIPILAVWSSIPMGLLPTAILVVNNLRDIEGDKRAGKHTLAVRFGAKGARIEYILLLTGVYLIPILMILLRIGNLWLLMSWISLLLVPRLLKLILNQTGRPLNVALAGTAQLTLAYALCYSLGLILSFSL